MASLSTQAVVGVWNTRGEANKLELSGGWGAEGTVGGGAYLVPLRLKQGNRRRLMLQNLGSAVSFLCTPARPLSSLRLPVSLGTQG